MSYIKRKYQCKGRYILCFLGVETWVSIPVNHCGNSSEYLICMLCIVRTPLINGDKDSLKFGRIGRDKNLFKMWGGRSPQIQRCK